MIASPPATAVSPARPELSALLRAARENPSDVVGRLVLADWLEEYGDEADYARAELVRLQCQFQPELCSPSAPVVVPALLEEGATAPLLLRQDRLLAQAGAAWLGPLRELSLAHHFRRGMTSLEVDVGETQKLLARDLARAEAWAWVEGIELRGVTGRGLGPLASCRQLENVTSLAVFGELGRAEMRALSRTAWFGGLRELLLARSRVSDEALAILAEAAPPALEHLSLYRSCVTRHGVERLLRSGILDGLAILDLRYDRLGDAIAETLADCARPGLLRHLLLAGNGISARGCRALSRGAVASELTLLDLSRNPLAPEGAQILAEASLGHLTRLDVGQCQLTAEGARALLESPHLRQLEQLRLGQNEIDNVSFLPPAVSAGRLHLLDLSGNPFGEIALVRLALCSVPGRLELLSLGDCGVTPAALTALARSEWLGGLTGLDLGCNPLGEEGIVALDRSTSLDALGLAACELDDEAVERLVRMESLGGLTCLHLADNRIGPDGARALAEARPLAALVALELDGNAVGDEGAVGLIDSGTLEGLGLLSLRDCDVTDAGVVALARTPGLSRISRLALAGPDLGCASARALLGSPHADSLQVLSLQGGIRDSVLRRALRMRFGCEVTCWPSSG